MGCHIASYSAHPISFTAYPEQCREFTNTARSGACSATQPALATDRFAVPPGTRFRGIVRSRRLKRAVGQCYGQACNMHRTFQITAILALALAFSAPVQPILADGPIDCLEIESNIETQLGPFFVARLQEIKSYLEDGHPPIGIPAKFRLKSEEVPEAPLDAYSTRVVITDLTGDGMQEIVVTLSKGMPGWIGSSGVFVFQKCSDNRYTIHYLSADPASPYLADYSEVSVAPVRLLANRSSQLLVRYRNAPSGRCYDEVLLVIGQERDAWITYLVDEVGCGSRDVTFARRISARDPDATGRKGLLLSGDHWTGWGIYQFAVRPVRVFYTWD